MPCCVAVRPTRLATDNVISNVTGRFGISKKTFLSQTYRAISPRLAINIEFRSAGFSDDAVRVDVAREVGRDLVTAARLHREPVRRREGSVIAKFRQE